MYIQFVVNNKARVQNITDLLRFSAEFADGIYAHHSDTVARDDTVSDVAVKKQLHVTWHLSFWNGIRTLLQLEYLECECCQWARRVREEEGRRREGERELLTWKSMHLHLSGMMKYGSTGHLAWPVDSAVHLRGNEYPSSPGFTEMLPTMFRQLRHWMVSLVAFALIPDA